MRKLFILVAIAVIMYYMLEYYKIASKEQREAAIRQDEIDRQVNDQFLEVTAPKVYKDWEYTANYILDPANLFGFR